MQIAVSNIHSISSNTSWRNLAKLNLWNLMLCFLFQIQYNYGLIFSTWTKKNMKLKKSRLARDLPDFLVSGSVRDTRHKLTKTFASGELRSGSHYTHCQHIKFDSSIVQKNDASIFSFRQSSYQLQWTHKTDPPTLLPIWPQFEATMGILFNFLLTTTTDLNNSSDVYKGWWTTWSCIAWV